MAFAVSTVIAGAGLALSAGGLAYNVYNQNKASESQSAAAQKQAEIAAVQSENVAVQKQQLDLKSAQDLLQINSNKDVIHQQMKSEDIRQEAVSLDSRRRQREAIRQSIVAGSNSLVTATAGGANNPGSSVLNQVNANNAGQTNTNIVGIMQNQSFSKQLYDVNRTISNIYLNAQDANAAYVGQSKTLQSNVLDNQKKIYDLGGSVSLNYADAASYGGNAAIGAGLASFGNSIAGNYGSINKLTSYFGSSTTPGNQNYAQSLADGTTPV